MFNKFMTIFSRFTNQLSRFLPHCCVLCGKTSSRGHSLCYPCEELLPILSHNCPICAQFLPVSDVICGTCLHKKPPFDRTYALFPYEAPIVRMIIKLKFQHDLKIARLFGELFIKRLPPRYAPRNDTTTQNVQHHDSLPDLIIPIPLHSVRLRQRGFNQALEIARPISKALGIPIDIHGVRRSRPTLAQSSLPAKLRQQNMRQAFASNRRYDGLKIALLDDVVTTGHTAQECSQLLKEYGAREIDVWCVARRG